MVQTACCGMERKIGSPRGKGGLFEDKYIAEGLRNVGTSCTVAACWNIQVREQ